VRKLISIVLLVLLYSCVSMADEQKIIHIDDYVDYLIPKNSPVRYDHVGKYDVVSFKGQFVLTGTYQYGYLNADQPESEITYDQLDLWFIPDKKIAKLLPYWKQARPVQEMRFRNQAAFIKAVIPADAQLQLKQKKRLSVTGRISVLVNNYRASIECDSPTYSVNFISIYEPKTVHLGGALAYPYEC